LGLVSASAPFRLTLTSRPVGAALPEKAGRRAISVVSLLPTESRETSSLGPHPEDLASLLKFDYNPRYRDPRNSLLTKPIETTTKSRSCADAASGL
jgi:hypothetical protein